MSDKNVQVVLPRQDVDELIDALKGHGGFNPFWPCAWCKLKDALRESLES